ncbi:hypothetical protein [Streptomyces flaveolus]|uniref:hypothetical protein n=1 Tax=Streptomyces flaveolus TaxID=67297 RepID=UPI003699E06F
MVCSELARLRGLVGGEFTERVLAERLEHRLRLQGDRPVASMQGWFVKRGLPQRPGCWSHLCDDGVRMDTGVSCPCCDSVLGDRRAARRAVATSVAAQLGHLPSRERRQEVERRLQEQVQRHGLADLVRRERAVAEVAARREVIAGRRTELQAQRQEQAAAACVRAGRGENLWAGGVLLGREDAQSEVVSQRGEFPRAVEHVRGARVPAADKDGDGHGPPAVSGPRPRS